MNNKFPIFVGLENDQLTEDAAFSAALTCIYLTAIRKNKTLSTIKKENFDNLTVKDEVELYFVPKNWDGLASKYFPEYQHNSILINVITPKFTNTDINKYKSNFEQLINNQLLFLNNATNNNLQVIIKIARGEILNFATSNAPNTKNLIYKIILAGHDSRYKLLENSINPHIRINAKIKSYKFFIGQMHILLLDLLNSK